MPPAKPSPDQPQAPATIPPLAPGPLQKELLLEWTSPNRPYKKLSKEVFSTVLAGTFLLGVVLFFIDGAIPVIALISLVFLIYVMGTVPPTPVTHTLTNWGIESEGKSWPWQGLIRYWIQGQDHTRMLVVETSYNWPRHLRFMLGDVDEKKLTAIIQNYLIEDRPAPNWLDKSGKWLESKVRLSPES